MKTNGEITCYKQGQDKSVLIKMVNHGIGIVLYCSFEINPILLLSSTSGPIEVSAKTIDPCHPFILR